MVQKLQAHDSSGHNNIAFSRPRSTVRYPTLERTLLPCRTPGFDPTSYMTGVASGVILILLAEHLNPLLPFFLRHLLVRQYVRLFLVRRQKRTTLFLRAVHLFGHENSGRMTSRAAESVSSPESAAAMATRRRIARTVSLLIL